MKFKLIALALGFLATGLNAKEIKDTDTTVETFEDIDAQLDRAIDAYCHVTKQKVDLESTEEKTQFIQKIETMNLVYTLQELLERFMDRKGNPDLSLREFGDDMIYLLNIIDTNKMPKEVVGLFENLTEHFTELMNDKKEASRIWDLTGKHEKANLVVRDILKIALKYIELEEETLLVYVSEDQLEKVKTHLTVYLAQTERKIKYSRHSGLSDLVTEIENIAEKMQSLWDEVVSENPEYAEMAKSKKPSKEYSKLELILIFTHRIKQNAVYKAKQAKKDS